MDILVSTDKLLFRVLRVDARQALQLHFEKECRNYKLQTAIFHEALLSCSLIENGV